MMCAPPSLSRWLAAGVLASAVVLWARRRGWLTQDGQVAAWALGFWIFGLGGWRWALPLLAFFASSSLLTRWEKHRPRDAGQVLANGGVPGLLLGGCLVHAGWRAWWAYIAALAFATGDTWASEIGRKWAPWAVSLRSGRRVPAGVSGAVSVPGTLAALLGGLFMVLLGIGLSGGSTGWALRVALYAWLAVGLDSLLGAWVQGQSRCPACGALVEAGEPHGCHVRLQPLTGFPWMTNNMVNLVAQLVAVALAWWG